MSNYHILTQSLDKKTAQIVFHIPVPMLDNVVGIPYRTALKQKLEDASEDGIIYSVCPIIASTELTQIQNGEIYEVAKSIRFSSLYLTNPQKRDELDAKYNSLKISAREDLEVELEWWGLARDVI